MRRADSWKNPDAGKDWGQKKGETEEEMVERHLTQWTWVWANSGRWWRIGKPVMLQSMGWQRVGHDLLTEHRTITNQRILHKLTTHSVTLSLTLSLKILPWKPSGSSEHALLLTWAYDKTVLVFATTWCQQTVCPANWPTFGSITI